MRLSRSDLDGALGFLRVAGEVDAVEPFPAETLALLADLIGRECWVGYGEVDRIRRQVVFVSASEGEADLGTDEHQQAYWARAEDHPIRRHRKRTGSLEAFKVYDFVTRAQLRRTQWWSDYLRPGGAESGFWISLCLPAPAGHSRTFTLIRDSADFDERDRALLNVLQPHLAQLRRTVEMRRRATVQGVPDGILSKRETEVLQLVAEGMRNREIAQALWIASGTVRKHLDNIYAKLGIHSRAAAAAWLHRNRNGT